MIFSQVKIAALVGAQTLIIGCAYLTGVKLERTVWVEKEIVRNMIVITEQGKSQDTSVQAGIKYSVKSAKISKVLSQTDVKLNNEIAASDIFVPGTLGVRLNAISRSAGEAGPATGELDHTVPDTSGVSDKSGSTKVLAPDFGKQ